MKQQHLLISFMLAALALATGTTGLYSDPTSAPAASQPAPKVKRRGMSLDACRKAYMKGQYKDAIKGYRAILDAPSNANEQLRAILGLADALDITGQYQKNLDMLQANQAVGSPHADWHIKLADAMQKLGQYEQALGTAQQALELEPNNPRAIWTVGNLLEILGQNKLAKSVYAAVGKAIENPKSMRSAPDLVAIGKILDRHAVLSGKKASDQAKNILHNYFQKAYLDVDKGYWPAHLAAAEFLIEKHKAKDAAKELELANKLNPSIPDVIAARAMFRLTSDQAEKEIRKALSINPNHELSYMLMAVREMRWRRFGAAPPFLKKVLKINPSHPEALSLMVAAYVRMEEPEKAKPFIKKAEETNPKDWKVYQSAGRWLAKGRVYEEAEKWLLKAKERAPLAAEPLAELGGLYMQMGEEAKALSALEEAHRLDDFRGDVVNYLNIVRKLQKFAVKETDHFIVKVDPKYDLALLDQVSDYMESIYPEVVSDMGYEPKKKTIIEILPFQKDFSARIAGSGWIPTVGACTGRVIAITAPNKKRGALGMHNWAQVLRHEFAHTVTLEMTSNRIPHWFTESCAVWQQRDKRAFRYVAMLVNATRKKELYPVSEITWGFIRPKRRGARALAYAQSEWILDYIIQTRGFETVRKMLRGFAEGKTQEQVFNDVLGVSQKQFDKAFNQWARKTIKQWGYDPETPPKLEETEKLIKQMPNDAKAHAMHAQALYGKRKLKDARQAAEKALSIKTDQPLALRTLGLCQLQAKQWDQVIRTARKLEQIDPESIAAPRLLAMAYLQLAEKDQVKYLPQAISALQRLQGRNPLDAFSYQKLAEIYKKLGQPDKALPHLVYLHNHTMNNPKYARQVAEIYRAQKQYPQAGEFFKQVTYINPYEPSAHEGLASVHIRQKQYDEAKKSATTLTLLDGKNAKNWAYLSKVLYRQAHAESDAAKRKELLTEAQKAAEKSVEMNASGLGKTLLDRINSELKTLQ